MTVVCTLIFAIST